MTHFKSMIDHKPYILTTKCNFGIIGD